MKLVFCIHSKMLETPPISKSCIKFVWSNDRKMSKTGFKCKSTKADGKASIWATKTANAVFYAQLEMYERNTQNVSSSFWCQFFYFPKPCSHYRRVSKSNLHQNEKKTFCVFLSYIRLFDWGSRFEKSQTIDNQSFVRIVWYTNFFHWRVCNLNIKCPNIDVTVQCIAAFMTHKIVLAVR